MDTSEKLIELSLRDKNSCRITINNNTTGSITYTISADSPAESLKKALDRIISNLSHLKGTVKTGSYEIIDWPNLYGIFIMIHPLGLYRWIIKDYPKNLIEVAIKLLADEFLQKKQRNQAGS